MAIRDLVPWNRKGSVDTPRDREDPFWALQREMNRMFEDFGQSFDLAPWPGWGREEFTPRIDVREAEDEILVTAEMPGLEEKDFELTLAQDVLTLKGEKHHEHEESEKGSFHRIERRHGAFQRAIPLPCEVEEGKATASYKNGVLSVRLPKSSSSRRRARQIEVKGR